MTHFHKRITTDPNLLNARTKVYAIYDGEYIKIGKTALHPTQRLSQLQTANPRKLTLIAYTSNVREKTVHNKLAYSRIRGEWFRPTLQVLTELRTWDYYVEGCL
jgi:hypothetical protein